MSLTAYIAYLQSLQAQGWDGEATWTASSPPAVPPEPMRMVIDNRITLRKEQGR